MLESRLLHRTIEDVGSAGNFKRIFDLGDGFKDKFCCLMVFLGFF